MRGPFSPAAASGVGAGRRISRRIILAAPDRRQTVITVCSLLRRRVMKVHEREREVRGGRDERDGGMGERTNR